MHTWDLPPDQLEYIRLAAFLIQFFFLFGNSCVKISILLVYHRISARTHSYWFIRLTWAAITVTILYAVGLGLELMLVCRPLESYWKSLSPTYTKEYTCGNEQAPIIFSAVASILSDVYASVLPMLWTRTLNLSSKQRLGLYALFSAGLFTATIGLVRLTYLVKITENYTPGPDMKDVTWYGWPTFVSTTPLCETSTDGSDIDRHRSTSCHDMFFRTGSQSAVSKSNMQPVIKRAKINPIKFNLSSDLKSLAVHPE